MKKGFAATLAMAVVPWCLAWLMRLWFATCRVRVHNEEYLSQAYSPPMGVVVPFWHYTVVFVFYFFRKYPATAMVSASGDGDYVAQLAKHLGFNTVRGSSNNKGVGALKKLIRVVRSGDNCAIVADGSQGPPMVAQPGAVLVASMSGVPMLPVAWSGSRCIAINSWDRTLIPLPFSRIDFYYGKPINVPGRLKGEEIEEYRLQLERSLNTLYVTAWGHYNKLEH